MSRGAAGALRRRGCASAAACPPLPPGLARLGVAVREADGLPELARARGPEGALSRLVELGAIEHDEAQARAAGPLQRLWRDVRGFASAHASWRARRAAWLAELRRCLRQFRAAEAARRQREAPRGAPRGAGAGATGQAPPRRSSRDAVRALLAARPQEPALERQGCYLWGDVGRGKSLLMDLLVASLAGAEAPGPSVLRRHYHDFARELHQRLHQLRREGAARAAVGRVAAELAGHRPAVICLDEFQVTNIADAVILQSLFQGLFSSGAVVVMTSNRPPEDLYKDGLNHMLYVPPLLRLLRARVDVCQLASPTDYREGRAAAGAGGTAAPELLVSRAGPDGDAALREAFERAAGRAPEAAGGARLRVAWGRTLPCQAFHGGVASFSFHELCGAALGADDYGALVEEGGVHTVVLSDVPRFTTEEHNEARRFTNLVDCLYERHCRLVCTVAAPLDELMAEMELLSHVPLTTQQPAMGLAGSEKSIRRHGDVTFAVSDTSPCRPDTFATAEADAESGTGGACEVRMAIQAAKAAAARGAPAAADPTEQDGVAGVMSAAVVSLQESGFAARRCISRLREMGSPEYRAAHRAAWRLRC